MPRRLGDDATASGFLRDFTNREEERDALFRLVDTPAGTPLPVLHFHGVGGAGKTWLLHHLKRELADPKGRPFVRSALLDLNPGSGGVAYHTDPSRALAYLRNQFHAVPCPRFDTAYAWLRHKERAGDEPVLRGSGAASEAFELVKDVAGSAADTPGVGPLLKRAGTFVAERFKGSGLEKWVATRQGQEDFPALRAMDAQQIYPQLTDRLLRDLRDGLDRRPGFACRAVLFIDTVEELGVSLPGAAQRFERSAWLRELHAADSPVLLVLAGRDRLQWDRIDAEYGKREWLEQHLIGGLSPADAGLFLDKSGLADPALRAAVLRASVDAGSPPEDGKHGYHPLSLGLCVAAVRNEQDAGKAIDPATFDLPPSDVAALAQRFLRSLPNDACQEWVRRLALTPRFDDSAAGAAYEAVEGHSSRTALDLLHGFSFVQNADEPGWFTLHARLRDVLAGGPTATVGHEWWRTYWAGRSQGETDEFAGLAWFHGWRLDPKAARKGWVELAERLRGREMRMAEHYAVLDWWEPTGLMRDGPTDWEQAAALNWLGDEYYKSSQGDRGENLRAAVVCHEAALRVFTEVAYPRDWASAQIDLGNAHADRPDGDRAANLRAAVACYDAALRVRTEAALPREWASAQINLGAAHWSRPDGDRAANLRAAVACCEAALRVFTEATFPQRWAATQHNLGAAHAHRPDGDRAANLRAAVACYNAALRVDTEAAFPQRWAATQNNLGDAHWRRPDGDRAANLRAAVVCYNAALRVFTEAAFPLDWAGTQNNLGNAHWGRPDGDRGENVRAAAACYEAALRVFTEAAFPQHWAETRFNLGLAYEKLAVLADRHTNLTRALGAFTDAERGFSTANVEMALPRVRKAIARVRAELDERPPG